MRGWGHWQHLSNYVKWSCLRIKQVPRRKPSQEMETVIEPSGYHFSIGSHCAWSWFYTLISQLCVLMHYYLLFLLGWTIWNHHFCKSKAVKYWQFYMTQLNNQSKIELDCKLASWLIQVGFYFWDSRRFAGSYKK